MRVATLIRSTTLLALLAACAPLGPATREGMGVPVATLADAYAIADGIGPRRIIVIDTLVLRPDEALPGAREIARIRVVRGVRLGCRAADTNTSVDCPTLIWVETRRPQWTPR